MQEYMSFVKNKSIFKEYIVIIFLTFFISFLGILMFTLALRYSIDLYILMISLFSMIPIMIYKILKMHFITKRNSREISFIKIGISMFFSIFTIALVLYVYFFKNLTVYNIFSGIFLSLLDIYIFTDINLKSYFSFVEYLIKKYGFIILIPFLLNSFVIINIPMRGLIMFILMYLEYAFQNMAYKESLEFNQKN